MAAHAHVPAGRYVTRCVLVDLWTKKNPPGCPGGLESAKALRQRRKAQAFTVLAVSTYSSIWLKFMYW